MECGLTDEFLSEFEPLNSDERQYSSTSAHSVVVVRRHTKSQLCVAIKRISKRMISGGSNSAAFHREIAILQQLDHPFIAKFFGVVEDSDYISIIMEHVPKGTLENYIVKYGSLGNDVAQKFFVQLLCCVDYIHCQHVIHRDIKPDNVLLDTNYNIKLIDFGLSNKYSSQSPLKTRVGTPCYASPEIFRNTKYTKAADIWSLGVTLYRMVTGCLPFYSTDFQELCNMVCYQQVYIPGYVDSSCADLIQRMLNKDGSKRIDIDSIKRHPWVRQCKLSRILDNDNMNVLITNPLYQISTFESSSTSDMEIISFMDKCGYDTSQLKNYSIYRDENEVFATYKILKTKYVTRNLQIYLQEIEKNSCNYPNAETTRHSTNFHFY